MEQPVATDDLQTVDELASAVGMTVRTLRYYASLGLLPPPVRRGRVAWYDATHRARLEMVLALQEHGFTLQAVERYMSRLPGDAGVEDLALQRAMLTSWSTEPPETLSRRELEQRVGRRLREPDLAALVAMGGLERNGRSFVAFPGLGVAVELLDLDIPVESMGAAAEAIGRHMDALAGELTVILHQQVLEPFRRAPHSPEDAVQLERTMSRLRRLTLEAVVTGFQRAANQVIARSLSRDAAGPPGD